MASDLTRAYRACARTTRRNARNFYFAFLSLPRAQRRAVYALYAFCDEADRLADDASTPSSVGRDESRSLPGDEATAADLARRRAGLKRMRARLAAAASGHPQTERDRALSDAIARFGVRDDDLADVLIGIEMDLEPVRIATYDELRTYCYHVASAVGLATLPILSGGAPATDAMRQAAIDLGLGMQFVNVLRDVEEDLTIGRIYIPTEELASHGVDPSQLAFRTMNRGLRAFVDAHAARSRDLLARGRRLLADLPRSGRTCPWLLSEIYGRILERIVSAEDPLFAGRTSLPTSEKLWLLLSSPWRTL